MINLSNLVAGLINGLDDTALLLQAVAPFKGQVGIELFLHSHSEEYRRKLQEVPLWLGNLPRTTHGPFIGLEATSQPLSAAGQRLLEGYQFAFEAAHRLGSHHLVFHSNECVVTAEQKPLLQRQCLENLHTILAMSERYGIRLLIENLALPCKGTPIFDEQEYLALFARYPQAGSLVDIGHLYLAGWDTERVLHHLQERVVGYHLHNNDGKTDSHQRIGDGAYDFDSFFTLYRRYTPHADLTLEYADSPAITVADLQQDLSRVIESAT